MPARPVRSYVFSGHAIDAIGRRGLTIELVESILAAPGERRQDRAGRDLLQSLVFLGDPPHKYVVRVVIDVDRTPATVVTAFRSSKIAKYWRGKQ